MFKTSNLTYKYEKQNKALNNMNLDFSNGNMIGIIGANGSGKSTLFMNLMGILKPTQGQVFYKGKELTYKKKDLNNLRKEVSIVFQDPDKQIFYSRVYDDVAFSLRNLGIEESEINERVKQALTLVNSIDLIDKPVHFLSYGQKKRVAIASVIAMNNKVVLLDEPTAGLDPESTKAIVKILKNLCKEGIKVVISSHDMDLIYEICDYIYVLSKGSIVIEGNCIDVFKEVETIQAVGLNIPWLVKVYKNMNLPLFKKEEELYEYFNNLR
ncbi:ABC transporter cobalt-specific ATP-binding protein [[Clostridium] sordellii]|uniref:energy-coupling factor ABC transporter ATP-binding protein n=1 Tax=Paraclostridium sordellii TaxID=1505 RepID=UPI0005E78154|nr:ATP-binding cassette domain-containing protein [Paeniclostridium sordellii]CEP44528.1 ABC transporter cobalt-specific ATP-binding protein [[Clostridium] sordellii] [Paeniclostridium sordellii]